MADNKKRTTLALLLWNSLTPETRNSAEYADLRAEMEELQKEIDEETEAPHA